MLHRHLAQNLAARGFAGHSSSSSILRRHILYVRILPCQRSVISFRSLTASSSSPGSRPHRLAFSGSSSRCPRYFDLFRHSSRISSTDRSFVEPLHPLPQFCQSMSNHIYLSCRSYNPAHGSRILRRQICLLRSCALPKQPRSTPSSANTTMLLPCETMLHSLPLRNEHSC